MSPIRSFLDNLRIADDPGVDGFVNTCSFGGSFRRPVTSHHSRLHVQVSFPNQISGPECVSVKDQRSLSSTSRKHHGANWAFILKRIGETCRLRLCDARTPSAELGNHWSESWPTEEVVARVKLNFNRPNPTFSLNYFGVAIWRLPVSGHPRLGDQS